MEITSSYKVQILNPGKHFRDTEAIYRKAISYLITVVESEWSSVRKISDSKLRMMYVERLVHTTKSGVAKYPEFDLDFYKFPCYLRRAAINAAVGSVSSYHSALKNWEDADPVSRGKAPKLTTDRFLLPCFYKGNLAKFNLNESDTILLKLFLHGDWVWVPFKLLHTDVNYLRKYWLHLNSSAPSLEKHHGKVFLRFSFTENVSLSESNVLNQTICSVDIGLNSDAVCTAMLSDGTVLGRKFINFPSEKDHLYRMLNRIKKFQREHGSKYAVSIWDYTKRLNDELSRKIAKAIVDFAVLWNCDVIVFEHLDFSKKKRAGGKNKQRLHMWRKRGIQNLVEHKAHRCGMRISRICAWGTSRLAFDGSGPVIRGADAGFTTNAMCRFQNGKTYNCDLSASYNIGARYFIREILKTLPAKERSRIVGMFPNLARRTSCTYADLLVLSDFAVCKVPYKKEA